MIVFDVFIKQGDTLIWSRQSDGLADHLAGGGMHFLVIENYRHTELGTLGRVATSEGHTWRSLQAYAGEELPQTIAPYAGLVVLGRAQDALADEAYPFLPGVCSLIRTFHEADKPVLGICLGAQLVARTFGARNLLGLPVEFGWREVLPTVEGRKDPLTRELRIGRPQFHWHTDTMTLPDGALHLATSAMTPIQAFRLGRATYAIQFHFETGLQEVRNWSEHFEDEIRVHTPDWHDRFDGEAARHAPAADETGAAISRAWLQLL